jgi:hypothetical protein
MQDRAALRLRMANQQAQREYRAAAGVEDRGRGQPECIQQRGRLVGLLLDRGSGPPVRSGTAAIPAPVIGQHGELVSQQIGDLVEVPGVAGCSHDQQHRRPGAAHLVIDLGAIDVDWSASRGHPSSGGEAGGKAIQDRSACRRVNGGLLHAGEHLDLPGDLVGVVDPDRAEAVSGHQMLVVDGSIRNASVSKSRIIRVKSTRVSPPPSSADAAIRCRAGRSGRYLALCGQLVIPAALATPPGPPCPACIAVLDNGQRPQPRRVPGMPSWLAGLVNVSQGKHRRHRMRRSVNASFATGHGASAR